MSSDSYRLLSTFVQGAPSIVQAHIHQIPQFVMVLCDRGYGSTSEELTARQTFFVEFATWQRTKTKVAVLGDLLDWSFVVAMSRSNTCLAFPLTASGKFRDFLRAEATRCKSMSRRASTHVPRTISQNIVEFNRRRKSKKTSRSEIFVRSSSAPSSSSSSSDIEPRRSAETISRSEIFVRSFSAPGELDEELEDEEANAAHTMDVSSNGSNSELHMEQVCHEDDSSNEIEEDKDHSMDKADRIPFDLSKGLQGPFDFSLLRSDGDQTDTPAPQTGVDPRTPFWDYNDFLRSSADTLVPRPSIETELLSRGYPDFLRSSADTLVPQSSIETEVVSRGYLDFLESLSEEKKTPVDADETPLHPLRSDGDRSIPEQATGQQSVREQPSINAFDFADSDSESGLKDKSESFQYPLSSAFSVTAGDD